MAKTKDSNIEAPPAGQLMYVGPRRKDPIPLERGNVFTSLPPVLQKAVAEDATLAALFVPLDQAGKALRQAERSVK